MQMPAKSIEALYRKAARRKEKRNRKPSNNFAMTVRKGTPEYRRTLPKAPDMNKTELRRVIADAFQNTMIS